MLKQKVDLGLISIPEGRTIPKSLSGKIKSWLIAGEECNLSEKICSQYIYAKRIFCPDIEPFTCTDGGTPIKSKKTTINPYLNLHKKFLKQCPPEKIKSTSIQQGWYIGIDLSMIK